MEHAISINPEGRPLSEAELEAATGGKYSHSPSHGAHSHSGDCLLALPLAVYYWLKS